MASQLFTPDHLRAVAYLYGVEAPPAKSARVLVLDCANELDWLGYCARFPRSEVVVLDIQQKAGKAEWNSTGITNLQVIAAELEQVLQHKLDPFDYILIGGILHFAPNETLGAVLDFAASNLSENGAICLSYPVLPGWRLNETLRDAMLFHSSLIDDSTEKIGHARAMLALMESVSDSSLHAKLFKFGLAELGLLPDEQLAIAYLEGLSQPGYFVDMMSMAESAKLKYIGDAELSRELPGYHGEKIADKWKELGLDKNKVLGQQYLDFLSNRASRHSLFTHFSYDKKVLSEPDGSFIDDLNWACEVQRAINVETGEVGQSHVTADGQAYMHTNALKACLLDALGEAWPFTLSFKQLCAITREPTNILTNKYSEHEDAVRKAIQELLASPVPLRATLEDDIDVKGAFLVCPQPIPQLIERQCKEGKSKPLLYNLWQVEVELLLFEEDIKLIAVIDGTRSIRSLIKLYEELIGGSDHSNSLQQESGKIAHEKFFRLIEHLRMQGVLLGSPSAWIEYYKCAADYFSTDSFKSIPYILRQLIVTAPRVRGGLSTAADITYSEKFLKRNHKDGESIRIEKTAQSAFDFYKVGNVPQAEAVVNRLLERYEKNDLAWHYASNIYLEFGRVKDAYLASIKALSINPRAMSYYGALASNMLVYENNTVAKLLFQRLIALDRTRGDLWGGYASAINSKSLSDAERCAREALRLAPKNSTYLANVGLYCSLAGKHSEAAEYYRKSLEVDPDNTSHRSALLFVLQHDFNIRADELYLEHVKYGEIVEQRAGSARFQHWEHKSEGTRIRVGFVSGDLRAHPVVDFFEPYLKRLDRSKFEIFIYSTSLKEDRVTSDLKKLADSWLNISNFTNLESAKKIHEDGIKILFDLSGHTAFNRLAVFAYKPAPVQISWLGYPGSTGLSAMDYVIIASSNLFGNIEQQFTEKLITIPDVVLFKRNEYIPNLSSLPFDKNGVLTFGSFNRPQKITDQVLSVWAEILKQLPSSRFFMANMPDDVVVDIFREKFQSFGVDPARIKFEFRTSYEEYLLLHQEVDLLLDTFPYNGGTTTSVAVSMGIPTLTLAGSTLASRHGVPILTQYQLTDFIAYSVEGYVEKAVNIGAQVNRLREIRAVLSDKVLSEEREPEDLVRMFEFMLLEVWRRFQSGRAPELLRVEQVF